MPFESDITTPRTGATFGVGSLPHRSMTAALDFAWNSSAIPTIPSLPRRSPAEGMIAQALSGIEGVSFGQYGGISIDAASLVVSPNITSNIDADAFGAFAAFLETFEQRNTGITHVKWQFVGPITLSIELMKIGLEPREAIDLALRAVRTHVSSLETHVRNACGNITQIIVLDEPSLAQALEYGFVISTEEAIDLVSGALMSIPSRHISGLHSCAKTNWGAMLATGANVLSIPVPSSSDAMAMGEMLVCAPRISEHLERGGRIAWGAVRTDGPISVNADRSWKALMESMCELVKAGVDPLLVRRMSYLTPACGLGTLSDAVASRVMMHVADVAAKVAEQATASRLTLGS